MRGKGSSGCRRRRDGVAPGGHRHAVADIAPQEQAAAGGAALGGRLVFTLSGLLWLAAGHSGGAGDVRSPDMRAAADKGANLHASGSERPAGQLGKFSDLFLPVERFFPPSGLV